MTHPFTLAILEPCAFDVRCTSEHALAVATLGWWIGCTRWGLA